MNKIKVIPKKERYMYYQLLLDALSSIPKEFHPANSEVLVTNPTTGISINMYTAGGFCYMFKQLSKTTKMDNERLNTHINTYCDSLKILCPELWKYRTSLCSDPVFWYHDIEERIDVLKKILDSNNLNK